MVTDLPAVVSIYHIKDLHVLYHNNFTYLKMLMNALLVWTTVNTIVIIPMGLTHVRVVKDSGFIVMDNNVMVS